MEKACDWQPLEDAQITIRISRSEPGPQGSSEPAVTMRDGQQEPKRNAKKDNYKETRWMKTKRKEAWVLDGEG